MEEEETEKKKDKEENQLDKLFEDYLNDTVEHEKDLDMKLF